MTENDARNLYEQATGTTNGEQVPVLHVRVMGRSRDIAFDLLDIGPASTDDMIRVAVARFMELSEGQLKDTVIKRHTNGNMTLRPEAVFG